MSLNFKSIDIRDYFSIDKTEFTFESGIYLIEGENRDLPNFEELRNRNVSVSNGSGKTTLFSAPYQCLFNKNSKDNKASIGNVGNIYTNKPYNITLTLEKDDSTYVVENNRTHNKIFIVKDGIDITPKGVANQLVILKNIIGFDFQTFSSLTFLNQQSLANIIDLTNKDNIVYQFFDIEKLNSLEKELKRRKKLRLEDRAFLVSSLSVVNKHLALVQGFSTVNVDSLREVEKLLKTSLLEVEVKTNSPKVKLLREMLDTLNTKILSVKVSVGEVEGAANLLKKQKLDLASGTCPTCNQEVSDNTTAIDKELVGYREEYKDLANILHKLDKEYLAAKTSLSAELLDVSKQKTKIVAELNTIKTKIILGDENNSKYAEALKNTKELEEEKVTLEAETPLIDNDIRVLDALLSTLKSGAVVNVYLKKYRLLFLRNFRALKKYTSFDIDITITVEKGKMNYTFFDGGKEKSFLSLSAGERTRVSLMLLLATLSTIEQLTNITINYLVLDELLGVLDHDGISFLEKVLDDMRGTKSIYIITHHNEIAKDYADGVVKVVRENNLSTVEG